MPRRTNNRVGVEVDSIPSHKSEDEPQADTSHELLHGSLSARQLTADQLEAAKAQRQKELLRKKKAERRAHAKQRAAEKQRRQDEKKQTHELLQMREEDVPAIEPPTVLIDTSTSMQSLDCPLGKSKNVEHDAATHDAATSVSDACLLSVATTEELQDRQVMESKDETASSETTQRPIEEVRLPPLNYDGMPTPEELSVCPPATEIVPKKVKGSPQYTKSANAAAITIQKALKKKYKKCKTMFRQSPRVFAEEVVFPSPHVSPEERVETLANGYDDDAAIDTERANTGALESELVAANHKSPTADLLYVSSQLSHQLSQSGPLVPPLLLPEKPPGTPPPRPRSSMSSRSSSCSSSCSCSSDSGSFSSCSSCSCSCSSSSSSSATKRKRRRSARSRHSSRTARTNRRRTDQSSRSHSHSSIVGPSSALLLTLSPPSDGKQYGELHHFMATRIQARIRGVRGRAKARQRQIELDEELKDEALHELQQEAVVKIQTRARGVLVRKKMPISDKERRRRRRRRSQLRNSDSHPDITEDNGFGVYDDPDEIGKWPEKIDLELLDEWQELSQPATTFGDTVTHTQFLSRGRLRVFCGTWNMHAKKPTDDLRLWIRLNKYHIVAVGSEECVNSIAKSVVFTSKKSWEDQLRSTLGEDYILVASHALTAIHNIVFVHASILPLLGNIQSDAVATGLGNQLGNKGGVGISFTVGATSFAFINSHFDAHQRNVSKRNGNFHRINLELKLSPTGAPTSPTSSVAVASTSGGAKGDGLHGLGRTSANRFSMPSVSVSGAAGGSKRTVSERFDRVFWYGDLNYRINGTRRMVDTLLLRNQHEVLYANDQLQREMQAGNVFAHFREGQLHFRPTYKFDKRSDTYDSSSKQRIPSWTDRVLYLSNDKAQDIELLSYRSQTDFRTSDHRPVCGIFQVNFRAAGILRSLQSPRSSSNHDNGPPHENRATSQACSIQ
ncbi:unnamed protein product [Phytophthora lilii]|uniref:Unnamed protein product n=1 Tax=Phytophthora lilii TaxID=2077276 RepID=A0A9W6WY00_9STRA|nr:unnamed protein product [Phytophthora lilii]